MSDLRSTGSTSRWRRRRAIAADQLAAAGVVECWRYAANLDAGFRSRPDLTVEQSPRCTETIRPGDRWVLGHQTDRADGGTDATLAIECDPCSRYTGGRTRARLRTTLGRTRRKW